MHPGGLTDAENLERGGGGRHPRCRRGGRGSARRRAGRQRRAHEPQHGALPLPPAVVGLRASRSRCRCGSAGGAEARYGARGGGSGGARGRGGSGGCCAARCCSDRSVLVRDGRAATLGGVAARNLIRHLHGEAQGSGEYDVELGGGSTVSFPLNGARAALCRMADACGLDLTIDWQGSRSCPFAARCSRRRHRCAGRRRAGGGCGGGGRVGVVDSARPADGDQRGRVRHHRVVDLDRPSDSTAGCAAAQDARRQRQPAGCATRTACIGAAWRSVREVRAVARQGREVRQVRTDGGAAAATAG